LDSGCFSAIDVCVFVQSLDLVWVIFVVGPGFLEDCHTGRLSDLTFVISGLRVLVVVVLAFVLAGASQLFEEVGVLDGSADFVVAAGPLAEIDAAAAVGAEGEVIAFGEYDVSAGGAAESFGHGVNIVNF
jgi:hypothetical protein